MDGENKQPETVAPKKHSKFSWRQLGLNSKERVITLLVFLCIVLAVFIWVKDDHTQPVVVESQCNGRGNSALYTTAVSVIASGKTEDLKAVAATVKTTIGYEKDPSCLYVLAQYALKTSDADNLALYLARIKAIDPNYDPRIVFGNNAVTIKNLELAATFLKLQKDDSKKSGFYGPEVKQ